MKAYFSGYFSYKGCTPPRPAFVVNDNKMNLWVSDIFVCNLSEIVDYNSPFSYNLWWVKLTSDRKSVASKLELYVRIVDAMTYRNFPYGILTKYIFDNSKIKEGVFFLTQKSLELKALSESLRYINKNTIKCIIEMIFGNNCFDCKIKDEDIKNINLIRYITRKKLKFIVLSDYLENLYEYFPYSTPYDILSRESEELENSLIVYKYNELDYKLKKVLTLFIYVRDEIFKPFFKFRIVFVRELPKINGLFNPSNNTISISVGKNIEFMSILSVFVHEMSHAYGYMENKNADDLTEEFERILQSLGPRIGMIVSSDKGLSILRGLYIITETEYDNNEYIDDNINPITYYIHGVSEKIARFVNKNFDYFIGYLSFTIYKYEKILIENLMELSRYATIYVINSGKVYLLSIVENYNNINDIKQRVNNILSGKSYSDMYFSYYRYIREDKINGAKYAFALIPEQNRFKVVITNNFSDWYEL